MWTLILTMRANVSRGPDASIVAVPGFRSKQLAEAAGSAWVFAERSQNWERCAMAVPLGDESSYTPEEVHNGRTHKQGA